MLELVGEMGIPIQLGRLVQLVRAMESPKMGVSLVGVLWFSLLDCWFCCACCAHTCCDMKQVQLEISLRTAPHSSPQ